MKPIVFLGYLERGIIVLPNEGITMSPNEGITMSPNEHIAIFLDYGSRAMQYPLNCQKI
jgi:hypothetical protein